MASVSFYSNFSKKKNSTKVPSGAGTSKTVRLKDNTSLYNPTFELTGNFPDYTYASWQGLYFYVTNITSVANGMYEIECDLDPMGSARGDILSMTAFVNRCEDSLNYDVYLKDVEMSAKQNIIHTAGQQTDLSGLFDGTGCYILRCVGTASDDPTGIATFACTEAELKVILNYMFTDSNFLDVLSDTVIKAVFNPFQYIVSLKYTPIAKSVISTGATNKKVAFGWWNAAGTLVPELDRVGGVYPSSGTPPSLGRTSLSYFGDFRDNDPEFTDVKLTIPGGNTVTLPSIWNSLSDIKISVVYDIIVGEAILFLHSPSGSVLASFPFKCAADIQIGQIATQMNGFLGDVSGAVGSFICGNPIGVGSSAAGAVANILQPSPSILGQNTAMQALITYRDPYFNITHYGSGASYPAHFGRMTNKNISLTTLLNNGGGFVKCSGLSVDTDLPAQYKDEINTMLNSGFFLE